MVGYYLVVNKNEAMEFEDKWMELQTVIQSKVIGTPKDRY